MSKPRARSLARPPSPRVVAQTERRRAALAPIARDERFRALVQHSADIITIHDIEGVTLYETPSASRVLGYPKGGLIGRSPFEAIHPRDVEAVRSAFETVLSGLAQPRPVEFRFRHADGSWIQLEAIGSNLLDDPGVGGIVLTSRDISARKAAERHIQYLANHDVVTGLPNRFLFERRLHELLVDAASTGSVLPLLLVDVDQFRAINDTIGRAGGDDLLRELVARIRTGVGEGPMIARIGNDEFAITLPGTDDAEAQRTGDALIRGIAHPVAVGDDVIHATATVGLAVSAPGRSGMDELLRQATAAVRASKQRGRSGFSRYDPDHDARGRDRSALATALRDAIAADALELRFQPKVSLDTLSLTGVEALVRWRHPGRGLLSADLFVPLAEECGLIAAMSACVLRAACRQSAAWARAGIHLPIAVNLSPVEFREPCFHDRIIRTIANADLPPGAIELEITEGVLLEDTAMTLAAITALRKRDIRVVIDDFGTGYSSLAYLNRLPLDGLKIDQSFVRNMESEPGAEAIVRAIVSLGRSLGMSTTAEGVRNARQVELLRAAGCHVGQGEHFGNPVVAGELKLPVTGPSHLLPVTGPSHPLPDPGPSDPLRTGKS